MNMIMMNLKKIQISRAFPLFISFFAGLLLHILWDMDLNYFKSTIPPHKHIADKSNLLKNPYPVDLLPANDYNKLINITDFNFTILNQPCKGKKDLLVVVMVHTAPLHMDNREMIRKTWGQKTPEIEVLFMLGEVDSEELQMELIKENEQYHDLIQGSFKDDYRNMTYKHVMVMKYVTYHCPQAKYILKTDDDVFINMPKVIGYVQFVLLPIPAENFLFCAVVENATIFRNETKWAVSYEEYNRSSNYPTYCSGWGIIYAPDALFKLYAKSQDAPYYWIDDVHVTGIVAESTNISHISSFNVTLTENRTMEIISSGERQVLEFFLFGPIELSIPNATELWNTLYGTY